jgi:hypothetical protein
MANIFRELIGAAKRYVIRFRGLWSTETQQDAAQPDYAYWDKARRGKAAGLEISGLLLKPLASKIASYVLGSEPRWKCDDSTGQKRLNEWWSANHAQLLRTFEEALNLGDFYLVVNADLSVTLIPPHLVTPLVDERNFSKRIGWRIEQSFSHPTDIGRTMTIINEYTAEKRVETIISDRQQATTRTYRNLIGRLPVIHIPNRKGTDEEFGRPEAEAVIPLLQKYGAIFDAAVKGNIRQGRPTPVIEEMGDKAAVDAFFERYGKTVRRELDDGTVEEYTVIDFDLDGLVALPGTSKFSYKSPASMIRDVEGLLGLLFYLYLQHTEIPEFVWGNAIASSKASAEAQMPPFIKWLEKRRGLIEMWMMEIARVVLAYHSVFETQINAQAKIGIQWQPLNEEDGNLVLNAVKYAHNETGMIDDRQALELLPLRIENIDGALKAGKRQREERQLERDERDAAAIERLANTPDPNAGDEDQGNNTQDASEDNVDEMALELVA